MPREDGPQLLPDLGRFDQVGRQHDAVAGPPHLPADQEILGQEVLERRKTADRVQRRPRHQDGLAHHARHPEDARDRGRAGLQAAVQVERFHARGEADRSGRDEQVRDQPDAAAGEVGRRPREKVRAHADVSVRAENQAVPGAGHRRGEAVDLGVASMVALVEDERARDLRMAVGHPAGDGIRGIRVVGEGEDDLVAAVVQPVEALEVVLQALVETAQRLQDRDAGRERGTRIAARRPAQAPQRRPRRRCAAPPRRRARRGRCPLRASRGGRLSFGQAHHADARAAPQRGQDALAGLLRMQERLPCIQVLGTVKVAVGQVRQALPRDDRIELPAATDLPEIEQRARRTCGGSRGTTCWRTTRSSRAGGRRPRRRRARGSP